MGELAHIPVIGDLARRDVPTCGLDSRAIDVDKQIRSAGWDQCVVVNDERVFLGRVRLDDLGHNSNTTVEQVMQEGPTTFRASVSAHEMLEYMMRRGRMSDTLVTDPEGRLIGVIRRDDLEETVHRMHAHAAADEDEEEKQPTVDCPCCATQLTRAGDLPEIRGWMRYGDRYCADCSWVFPRELLEDERALVDACPCHGPINALRTERS